VYQEIQALIDHSVSAFFVRATLLLPWKNNVIFRSLYVVSRRISRRRIMRIDIANNM